MDSPNHPHRPPDIMLVCVNGHQIAANLREPLEKNAPCSRCGAETIHSCPHCGENIPGNEYIPNFDREGVPKLVTKVVDRPPDLCEKCGNPFPWAKRETEA